jgi:hypothetical protein
VTAAPLTVTANPVSRAYDTANPALGYSSNGLMNGNTLSGGLTTTATTSSDVGAYAITQGTLAASANYAMTFIGADLTVMALTSATPPNTPAPTPAITPATLTTPAAQALPGAYPSLFSADDPSSSRPAGRSLASTSDSACASLQALRSLNRYGLADLGGRTAPCKNSK